MSETPSDAEHAAVREIVSVRMFGFPRDVLRDAFRNPDRLSRWWGPAGFTNVFHEFDFRPGGAWFFTMRGPDGAEYSMRKMFVETAEPGRIVLDHPDPVHGFRMFMSFRDVSGGTELAWKMLFDSPDEAARVRALVLQANEQNFDRLADYLSTARV